jgi:hypothetical protein
VFVTLASCVPSGRARYTWAKPADWGRASEKTIHRPPGDHAGLVIPTVAGQAGNQRLRPVTGATGNVPFTVVP